MKNLLGILFFPKNHPNAWFWFKTILLGISSGLIAISRMTPNVKNQPILSWLVNLLNTSCGGVIPIILIFASPILIFIFDGILMLLNSISTTISYDSYKSLVTSFNEIVGIKLKRFISSKEKKDEPYCLTITQPDIQIIEIAQQVYNTIRYLVDADVKVIIAEIKENKVSGNFYCAPRSYIPSISDNDLDGETFFDRVVSLNRFECIEDLDKNFNEKSKRKQYKYLNDQVENGSIIGFPIKKPGSGTIQFVLTIKCSELVFTKKSEKKFGKILDMFFIRLQLERQLIDVRSKYDKCPNSKKMNGVTSNGGV